MKKTSKKRILRALANDSISFARRFDDTSCYLLHYSDTMAKKLSKRTGETFDEVRSYMKKVCGAECHSVWTNSEYIK